MPTPTTITEDGASNTIAGNLLANDTVGGIVGATLSVTNAGVLTGLYGTLTLNADGSYSYLLDQMNAALGDLNNGDALQETLRLHGDGWLRSRDLASDDHDQRPYRCPAPLFTAGDDVVDFNTVVAGAYINGTQFDALGGDDTIILPADATEAAQAGFVAGVPFRTGDGNNTVVGHAARRRGRRPAHRRRRFRHSQWGRRLQPPQLPRLERPDRHEA